MKSSLPVTSDLEMEPVVDSDFEELLHLRIAAMRESLERLGRFDPVRARERLRSTFSPEHIRFIVFKGSRVGFHAVCPSPEGQRIDHLYIHPEFQNQGIGGAVLSAILANADRDGAAVLVGALKGSSSNRFYQRHGFVMTGESEWDNYYTRPASIRESS